MFVHLLFMTVKINPLYLETTASSSHMNLVFYSIFLAVLFHQAQNWLLCRLAQDQFKYHWGPNPDRIIFCNASTIMLNLRYRFISGCTDHIVLQTTLILFFLLFVHASLLDMSIKIYHGHNFLTSLVVVQTSGWLSMFPHPPFQIRYLTKLICVEEFGTAWLC